MEYKKLQNLSFEDLGKGKSDYNKLMDKEPFKEGLEEIEVIEDGLPKKVLITKLSYIYSLLDSIYQNYDIGGIFCFTYGFGIVYFDPIL